VDDTRETLHDMVPDDTVLWLEIDSFDRLVEAFRTAAGDGPDAEASMVNPEEALAMLPMLGLPSDRLIRDKPLVVALSLELGQTQPRFSVMLPVLKPQHTAKAMNEASGGENKVMAQGDYVVLTNRSVLESRGDAGADYASVRGDALLGMRIDLARLMQRYGPQVEAGLHAAAMGQGFGQSPSEAAGLKLGTDWLRTLTNGLSSLQVRMNLEGSNLAFESSLQLKEGSKLCEIGSDDAQDLASMLRYAHVGQDELMVGSLRRQALAFVADPLLAWYESMPETPGQASPRGAYEAALELLSGDSVDFAVVGSPQNLGVFVQGMESTSLVSFLERTLETYLTDLPDLSLMAPRKGEDEASRFAQYDWIPNTGTPAVRNLKNAFGQPRMRLRLLGHGDETMATLGEGAPFLTRTEEASVQVPTALAWAFEHAQGASPALVSHTRLSGSEFERMGSELSGGTLPGLPTNEATHDAWVTSYMAMGKNEWRMGFQVDLKDLAEQAKAVVASGAAFALPR